MRPEEPDAFIAAVDAARERLARAEGRQSVSMREVLRRAGADDAMRAKVFYHLNREREWPRGHNVPGEVVAVLASVLPIEPEELHRAAQVAAGFDVVVDLPRTGAEAQRVVARIVGDISDQELWELGAHINRLIGDELLRRGQRAATA